MVQGVISPNWNQFRAGNKIERDFQQLQQYFGFSTALSISVNDAIKLVPAPDKDTLIFTYAKSGKFSVAKAYQL